RVRNRSEGHVSHFWGLGRAGQRDPARGLTAGDSRPVKINELDLVFPHGYGSRAANKLSDLVARRYPIRSILAFNSVCYGKQSKIRDGAFVPIVNRNSHSPELTCLT